VCRKVGEAEEGHRGECPVLSDNYRLTTTETREELKRFVRDGGDEGGAVSGIWTGA
jgi:hypothetical protein